MAQHKIKHTVIKQVYLIETIVGNMNMMYGKMQFFEVNSSGMYSKH
jgi:hypothetical protein